MKALVGAFNQEKALVGAFSVIVHFHRLINLRHYTVPSPCYLVPSAGPGPGLAYTTQLSWPQPQQQRHLVAGGSTPSAAAAVTSALCLLWCSHRPLRDTVTYSGLVWWKCVNVSVTKHLDTIQLESVEHFEFLDFSTDVMSSYFLCLYLLSTIHFNTVWVNGSHLKHLSYVINV